MSNISYVNKTYDTSYYVIGMTITTLHSCTPHNMKAILQ